MLHIHKPILQFTMISDMPINGQIQLIEPQYIITEMPILNDLPILEPLPINDSTSIRVGDNNIHIENYIGRLPIVDFEYLHIIDRIKNQNNNIDMLYDDIQYIIGVLVSLYGLYYFIIKILQSIQLQKIII